MASPVLGPAAPAAEGAYALTRPTDWVHFLPRCLIASGVKFADISSKAEWTLSSCKNDASGQFGIRQLMADSEEEYWRSDDAAPHSILLEFQKKTDVSFFFLYLDYVKDESYTPHKVVLQFGSSMMMLDEEIRVEFNKPVGWQMIDLRKACGSPRRVFVINMIVTQNHEFGKDCHIRRARVVGPVDPAFPSVMNVAAPLGEAGIWMHHPPLR